MTKLSTNQIFSILDLTDNIISPKNIIGISTDSRIISPENLYVPIIGEKFNGHDFIIPALNLGAAAALCSINEFENRKEVLEPVKDKLILVQNTQSSYFRLMSYVKSQFQNLITFGIGGTVGKTTTKELLRHICEAAGKTVYTKENLNTALGMCIAVNELENDTQYMVCEMGTDTFGEITTEAQIVNPDFGVCLNVGPTHAELLGGNIDGVAKAESELVQCFKNKGKIILNIDNEYVKNMQSLLSQESIIKMSKGNEADIYIENYRFNEDGLYLDLNNIQHIFIPKFFGDGNVYNAMAAISLAKLSGIEDETIINGLESYKPEKGRLNIYKIHDNITIQDDAYNANLDSMKQSIKVAFDLSKQRHKIFVLGDMLELGIHAEQCHKDLAQYLKKYTPDKLIYCGEYGETIRNGLIDTLDETNIHLFPKLTLENVKEIYSKLESLLLPDSWVLLKSSKGTGIWKLVDVINISQNPS